MIPQFLNFVKDYDVVFIKASYDDLIVNNGQKWTIDHDYLSQHKSKLIIVDFASEHWNRFDDSVYHDLDSGDYNFIVLTYDHTRHQVYPKMYYYPYWYCYTQNCKEWSVNKNNFLQSRKFDLGCLNGMPRPHRIANYYRLMKKSYKNKMLISFHNVEVNHGRQDDVRLLDEELNYWNKVKEEINKL